MKRTIRMRLARQRAIVKMDMKMRPMNVRQFDMGKMKVRQVKMGQMDVPISMLPVVS